MIGTTARWLVPPLLDAMATRHPKVRVVVVDATTTVAAAPAPQRAARPRRREPAGDDPDVEAEQLFDEDLLVIAPGGHPLADCERVTLAELAEHACCSNPRAPAFRDELDAKPASRA